MTIENPDEWLALMRVEPVKPVEPVKQVDDFEDFDVPTAVAPSQFAVGSQMQPALDATPAPTPPPAPAALLSTPGATPYVTRNRMWAFCTDQIGRPIELGSGRYAKAYLGEESWPESKTGLRRHVAIKCLQRGVTGDDALRFQLEKQILERVQGHPNIVEILGSGERGSPGCPDSFIPIVLRDKLANDFMVLELLDLTLEQQLKGARHKRRRDDLLALPMQERIFQTLDYVYPIASAIEFAHLERDICHRDIKPANILIKLADPDLRGSQTQVKLADFNVAEVEQSDLDAGLSSVPGTLYFQSPEQETNCFELLVNVDQGSPEVQYFEDFYIDIFQNDTFSLFNRPETYQILEVHRARKRLVLSRPFAEPDESNVRGRVRKAVGRPADVYSLGALFYYLITGAYGNPKNLYDAFRRFGEYEGNMIAAYIEHEYGKIENLRMPPPEAQDVRFEDKFFSYKHFLDGNGQLIDPQIMLIIAKAMIRNKPDSYCMSWDVKSTGISSLVQDLLALYVEYGVNPTARLARSSAAHYQPRKEPGRMRRAIDRFFFR